jgi:hypothetical protein
VQRGDISNRKMSPHGLIVIYTPWVRMGEARNVSLPPYQSKAKLGQFVCVGRKQVERDTGAPSPLDTVRTDEAISRLRSETRARPGGRKHPSRGIYSP